jgi:hypothetical protein
VHKGRVSAQAEALEGREVQFALDSHSSPPYPRHRQ